MFQGQYHQKTGTQLAAIIAAQVAEEYGVVMTSLPGSSPRANRAVVRPEVAEFTEIQ